MNRPKCMTVLCTCPSPHSCESQAQALLSSQRDVSAELEECHTHCQQLREAVEELGAELEEAEERKKQVGGLVRHRENQRSALARMPCKKTNKQKTQKKTHHFPRSLVVNCLRVDLALYTHDQGPRTVILYAHYEM